MISARLFHNLYNALFIGAQLFCKRGCIGFGGECRNVCIADRVFVNKAFGVLCHLLGGKFGNGITLGWRHNIHLHRCFVTDTLIKHDLYIIILSRSKLSITELAILRGPGNHIAVSGGERCATLVVALLCSSRVEFCVVINFKLHRCLYGSATLIYYLNCGCCNRCIVGCYINLGEAGGARYNLLGSIVFSESISMHQHSTRSGSIEPSEIKHRFGLTGTQEIPLTIDPGLDPSVIIVGVRPTGSIHLTSRDTD